MKIATISDLHMEFGWSFDLSHINADVLILAGDICTFKDLAPLTELLSDWHKPVIYIAGNHEDYTKRPMEEGEKAIQSWLKDHDNVHYLVSDYVTIEGINFFGGTMWTSFDQANPLAMNAARLGMNDYSQIYLHQGRRLRPEDTITIHDVFVRRLTEWFEADMPGTRVVVSHHAPVNNPKSQYKHSPLQPAFHSLDMVQIIERYQPDLWIHGHTHENNDQMIGKTRIISNQRGYISHNECPDFDESGMVVEVGLNLQF